MQTNHNIYIYLECEFNYKNFQRTSPICPAYHPTSQTIY